MSGNLEKGFKNNFTLPFTTSAANRLKDFTKSMEQAAILYLAESNREKGEGRFLKKPGEKLVFVTETYCPIWLISHKGVTSVFDGLGTTSHMLRYDILPDVRIFDKNVRENQRTTATYSATLIENADYFRSFSGKEENKIEGLIADPVFMRDLTIYLSQKKEIKGPFTAKAVLMPTIGENEIQASIEQLSNLRKKTSQDIENIGSSMRFLSRTTTAMTRKIREEIRETQRKYNKQIENIKPAVTGKIRRVQNKYHRKIIRASTRFKRRIQRLRENQVRLQKTLRHLRTEAKRCRTKIQSKRRGKKKQIETQWALRLKRFQKRLPTLQKEIEQTVKRIQNIENTHKRELAQHKAECGIRIEAASKPLRDLQASTEAEITMKREEIDILKHATSRIANQMNELVKAKKVALGEFHRISMLKQRQESELVFMPFYLIRYDKDDKKRYVAYPPSVVSDMGILTKMKGALGAARMTAMLQSRSKAISMFLKQIVALIEENPVLEKEITEAAIEDSVLLAKRLRMSVRKGLEELQSENWISEHELQNLSKVLYIYS